MRDFGSIAAPLNELTKKDVPFVWGDAQDDAFDDIETIVNTCSFAPTS